MKMETFSKQSKENFKIKFKLTKKHLGLTFT